jgi:hypothetical protein
MRSLFTSQNINAQVELLMRCNMTWGRWFKQVIAASDAVEALNLEFQHIPADENGIDDPTYLKVRAWALGHPRASDLVPIEYDLDPMGQNSDFAALLVVLLRLRAVYGNEQLEQEFVNEYFQQMPPKLNAPPGTRVILERAAHAWREVILDCPEPVAALKTARSFLFCVKFARV